MKVIAEVKGEEEGRKLMEKKKKEENYEGSRKWFHVLKLSKLKKMLTICYAPKPPSKRPQTTTPSTDTDVTSTSSSSSSSSPTTKSNFLASTVPNSDSGPSIFETGESSNSNNSNNDDPSPSSFICEICVESKPANESFRIKACSHGAYCTDCITKYVVYKLQENLSSIGCPVPDCGGYLEPEYCRPILPPKVFDRWGKGLSDAAEKFFYCPFKDCSSMISLNDDDVDKNKVVTESECPNCRRLLCSKCKVAWHSGIVCSKFQKLNKNEREVEDIMLMNLALKKRWGRCPNCRFYVEKTTGCNSVKCRCGKRFNYQSGRFYNSSQKVLPLCQSGSILEDIYCFRF